MPEGKDDKDKLRQAEEWIATAPLDSEQWKAAWDHVRYLLGMEPLYPKPAPSPELRAQVQEIANKALWRRAEERGEAACESD